MLKFVRILAAAYAAYALLMLALALRNFVVFFAAAQGASAEGAGSSAWVPLITFAIITIFAVTSTALLSYFLASRRHRTAAMIIAAITCIGFPVGTVLGALTIYALTRPSIRSEFVPTI